MILDDLADFLSSAGIGTVGTDLFKGVLPSTPDAAVAVLLYGGAPPLRAMSAGPGTAVLERPRVQVIARDVRYDAAAKKAQDAWFALDALGARTKNGVLYHSIYALQSPFFLERDGNNREMFAANYEVTRAPATSS